MQAPKAVGEACLSTRRAEFQCALRDFEHSLLILLPAINQRCWSATHCMSRSDRPAREALVGVAGAVGVLRDACAVGRGPPPHIHCLAGLPVDEADHAATAVHDAPLLVGGASVGRLSDICAIAIVRDLEDQAAVTGDDADM